MSTIITYNNIKIPSPTPFVELNRELVFFGNKWQNVDKIKLNGQLTGNFNQLISGQKELIDIFNQNLGSLRIYETLENPSGYVVEYTGLGSNGQSGLQILDGRVADPYPLEFNVNLDFFANDVKLYLNDMNHTYIGDIRACLVSPDNKKVYIPFNRSFGGNDITHANLIFSKDTGTLFNGTTSGTYRAATSTTSLTYYNISGPSEINNFINTKKSTSIGIFSDQMISGKWKFYVEDLAGSDTGNINYTKLIFSGIDIKKIYEKNNIIVNSINFDNSVYNGILNYTLEFTSKESKYNVENPVNEFSFSEDENKILNVNHRVSAQGINTSSTTKSNALDNAINFVQTFSGINNIPIPNFISQINSDFYLKDVKESINRLNSTYSIDETYVNDLSPYATPGGILRYSIDINSGAQSNVTEIKIQGDFTGPNFGEISDLRSAIDVNSLVSSSYSEYFNPIPLSYNINENSGENKISFDYSFDNIPLPNPYFDYKVDISRDELSQITNININAEIIARGNRKNRYDLSLSNLDSFTGNFPSIALSGLTQYNYLNDLTNTYNLRLVNIQIDKNPNEGKITASAKYDDKPMPPSGFSDGNFSINVTAPYWYMKPNAACNVKGYYVIQDFDILTLPKQSVSLDLIAKNDSFSTEDQFKNIAKNLVNNLGSKDYSFDFVSQEQTDITKKYNKSESLYKISYNIEKIATNNKNQLLPKFK